MRRSLFVPGAILALCPLAVPLPVLSAPDDELVVVPERDLSKYWVPTTAPPSNLEISGKEKLQFGCANVGFVIEKNGKAAPHVQVLSYRFNQELPRSEQLLAFVALELGRVIPKYAALPGVVSRSAIYTSRSVPIRSATLSKSLGKEDSVRLDRALAEACRMDDLAEALSNGTSNVQLEPLPSLTELLQQPDGGQGTEAIKRD